jgi:hypothetical protein
MTAFYEYPAGSGNYLTVPTALSAISGGYRIKLSPSQYLDIPAGFDIKTDKGYVRPQDLADYQEVHVLIEQSDSEQSFTPLGKDAVDLEVTSTKRLLVLSVEAIAGSRLNLMLSDGSESTTAQTEPLVCECALIREQVEEGCGQEYILPFEVSED